MWKSILPALLTVLLTLTACSDPTPAPTNTQAPTQAPESTSTQAPTSTPRPTATPVPTETAYAPGGESGQGAITPLMMDDPETLASELSESETACLAGTADAERLGRILYGTEESTPEELNAILGCLQDETLLRLLLSEFVQDPAPLSMETSACIRTGFEKIDLRGAMLATVLGNEQDKMMFASIFVTIACLNDGEWETAATVLGVDLGTRAAMMCLLEEMGGTAGLTAALEPGAEESFTALILAVTGCDLEMEGGTEPATTLVITIATVPDDIPEYDRSDWRHWIDEDGDCQDARQESLVAESLVPVIFETDRECRVATGRWYGAFTGVYVEDPSDLDIDHLVPLKNAHLSGGWSWDAEMKEEYANDLSDPDHLIAVTVSANRSKGAKGPEEWGPPEQSYWSQYATDWTEVKARWELTMTKVESEIVMDMLGTCENPPDLELWEAPGTATGEHQFEPEEESESSVYQSCEEAESAEKQRVQGSQGSGRGFPKATVPSARDWDGDGIVCER